MSNAKTMTTHEPINYLDSILNEEEKRCEFSSHQWRNFTISRSGRFKTKNKKREIVDGKLFDDNNSSNNNHTGVTKDNYKEQDKISARKVSFQPQSTANTTTSRSQQQNVKKESYKSFYETNL